MVNAMPQVDKATFLSITFWTFVLYTGGYVLLNLSALFVLFSSMKLVSKRSLFGARTSNKGQPGVGNAVLFPWIAL
jgi:hypothetical protein